jgi:hypothetical protein
MKPLEWVLYAKRTAITGAVSSGLTLLALLTLSRLETGSAPAALNGSSQLVRGRAALRARGASWRYTFPALIVHHASAHWWAAAQEHPLALRHIRRPVVRASALMIVAVILDYGLLPKRLSPGYEGQLSKRAIAGVFAVLGAGLALGSRVQRQPSRLSLRTIEKLASPANPRSVR